MFCAAAAKKNCSRTNFNPPRRSECSVAHRARALAAGSHNITATYNGSTDFTGSSGTVTQTVN